tara:strand:- start:100 stop:1233 length:1134 start_codon:yes stop_codon:yes gene_type:complete
MKLETIDSIELAKDFCSENFEDSSPFLEYNFFKLLEDTKCTNKDTGWIPKHLLIKQDNDIIGFIPNFKKLNSQGEYIFDQAFEQAYYQVGSNYFPKFLSGIPFTPVNRSKFIYSKKSIKIDSIIQPLQKFLKESETSSFHINFVDENISNILKNYNFFQRIGIQYHWKNYSYSCFKDYLDTMKSRKKKSILKERNFLKEKNVSFTHKEGEMIKESDIILLYKCYLNTIDKKWSRPYLNYDFFRGLINLSTAKQMLLVTAYQGKKVLGCSVHFVGKDTLYGRYWGCLEEIPYLHFELCYYQAIDYAIKHKLSKIEAGAQGEHKISRGYLPCLTFSNHWFRNDILLDPIKRFLDQESHKITETSNLLKKYSPFSLQQTQ